MLNPLTQLSQEDRHNLKIILEQEKAICAGQMVIVGLDDLKSELGDGWYRYCDRVHDVVSKIMANVLAPSEVFLKLGDDHYVVVFRDRDQAAARVVCKKILLEVRKTFLGAADMQSLDMDSMIISLNPDAFAESMGLVISTGEGRQADPQKQGRELSGKSSSRNRKDQAPFDVTAEEVWYIPMWDVDNKLVYNYSPTIIRETGQQKSAGYNALPDQKNLKQLRELDLFLAAAAFRDLRRCREQGIASIMTIPIHYNTIDNDAVRGEFHRLCKSMSPNIRNSAVFMLTGLSPGRPPWKLFEFTTILSQLGKTALAQISPRWERLGMFSDLPVKGLIVNLELETRGGEERLKKDLNRIKAFCDKKRIKMGVSGVLNSSQAMMAQRVGVKWLCGHRVLGPVDSPQPAMDFRALARNAVLTGERGVELVEDDLDEISTL